MVSAVISNVGSRIGNFHDFYLTPILEDKSFTAKVLKQIADVGKIFSKDPFFSRLFEISKTAYGLNSLGSMIKDWREEIECVWKNSQYEAVKKLTSAICQTDAIVGFLEFSQVCAQVFSTAMTPYILMIVGASLFINSVMSIYHDYWNPTFAQLNEDGKQIFPDEDEGASNITSKSSYLISKDVEKMNFTLPKKINSHFYNKEVQTIYRHKFFGSSVYATMGVIIFANAFFKQIPFVSMPFLKNNVPILYKSVRSFDLSTNVGSHLMLGLSILTSYTKYVEKYIKNKKMIES